MTTVKVFIRHELEPTGIHLTNYPINDPDALVSTIKAWGINGSEPSVEVYGQFIVTPADAGFEVVYE